MIFNSILGNLTITEITDYKIQKESCIFINDEDNSTHKFHNKYLYCFKIISKIELGKNFQNKSVISLLNLKIRC